MKRKWILSLQLMVLLLCIAGLFGKDKTWNMESSAFVSAQQEDGRTAWNSGNISLRPGVYRARLSYATQDDMLNAWSVEADGLSFDGLLANACMLYSGLAETDMYFWLLEDTDSLRIRIVCDESSEVIVRNAAIMETNAGARMLFVIFLTCFVIWDISLYRKEKNGAFFGMAVLVLVSSIPLFTGYEIASADQIGRAHV